ncbi:MAG: hypothetical protein J5J00_02855 [Deltaproteobacteria bacterium]|nr:hypothetical protein [Deltaproteobacteria bacterium]
MAATAFNDKRSSTAVTLGLLASLSLPAAVSKAEEPGPLLTPLSQTAPLEGAALSRSERMKLLGEICSLADESPKDAIVWSESLKEKLSHYRQALKESPDFSFEELKTAQHLAIYELNVHSFYKKLPPETKELFIAENVLTLHAALIERIGMMGPGHPERNELEYSTRSLLGDILWSEAFQSPMILQQAARLYGEQVLSCPEESVLSRIEHFYSRISSSSKLAANPELFESALNYATALFMRKGDSLDRETFQAVRRLCLAFEITAPQSDLLTDASRKYIGSPDADLLLGQLLGPLCGNALLSSKTPDERREEAANAALLFLSVVNGERSGKTGQEMQPKSGEVFVCSALRHALTGRSASELGGPGKLKTAADWERSQELRLAALHFSLGVLAGVDKALCDECKPAEKVDPYSAPGKSEDPFQALVTVRERVRTELGISVTGAWNDEKRAAAAAALLAADFTRHEYALEAVKYMEWRRKELGQYFPDVRIASREGRYASKVGEVRHFPPVQVKGEPSAYADLYFYTREALVSHRHGKSWLDLKTPDKELDQIAKQYAEASQMIFLSSLISTLWGEAPNLRPHEDHRGLSDERMAKEILLILKDFPCFDHDVLLSFRLGNTPADKFLTEVEKLKAEAIKTKLELEPRIDALLKKR